MHLGHFMPIRLARSLQDQGHELHLILGTITARLGDPSGQDKTRPFLTWDRVLENARSLLAICERVLRPGFHVHWNHEFVDAVDVPFFLTRMASRFTVREILARRGFRDRQARDRPIGLHELLVPLLQGWDSVQTRAQVEIGGADQLFNFQLARQLQRAEGQAPQVCLMTPLLLGGDGRKMSKSFGNAVWIDDPPEEVFGRIMSLPDQIARSWEPLLMDTPPADPHPMARKKALARAALTQVQGPEAAAAGQAHFESVIQRKQRPAAIQPVRAETLLGCVREVRKLSKSAGRRLIAGGGVRVGGAVVLDPEAPLSPGDAIRIGRRQHVVIVR